jgi:preprotein translocase subunit YajC
MTHDTLGSLIMLPLFFLVTYFVVLRPQRQRQTQQQTLQSSLKEGDEVATSGGACGIVKSINDTHVVLRLGKNDVVFLRSAMVQILPKGTVITG